MNGFWLRQGKFFALRISLVVALLVSPSASAAGSRHDEIRVALVKGKSTDEHFLGQILQKLNRYKRVPLKAEPVNEEQYGKCAHSQIRIVNEDCPYKYYVKTEVSKGKHETLLAKVTIQSGGEIETFTETDIAESPLLQSIMGRLILKLTKKIRIEMKPFKMLGPEKAYASFEEILRNMLMEGLNRSAGIVLLDSLSEKEEEEYKKATDRTGASYNPESAVEIRQQLHPNYKVMGEYGVVDGGLRLDVRCRNIETNEVVIASGISVEPIKLHLIEQKMAELAADIREAVETDFMDQRARPRTLAITGFPPIPKTKENRDTLLEIIRTTSRKLDVLTLENAQLQEDPDLVEKYLEKKQDRGTMSRELGADMLISLQLDRTIRDRPVLTADFYDSFGMAKDPSRISATLNPEDIGRGLDTLIADFAEHDWTAYKKDEKGRQMEQVRYRGLNKEHAFQLRIGASKRNAYPLFLDSGGGAVLDFSFVHNIFDSLNWQMELPHLRFDFMGERSAGGQKVIGGDVLAGLTYRFRPYYENDWYIGAEIGFLGLFRKTPADASYDGEPGAGIYAGYEKTSSSSRKTNMRIEYTNSFRTVPGRTIGGEEFKGGTAGGIYILIGTEL